MLIALPDTLNYLLADASIPCGKRTIIPDSTSARWIFTFTILQALPLCKAYMLDMRWWIAKEALSAELAIIISYPTSASGITVLLKTPTKHREFFPTLFVKTTDFQLVFNFEQTRTVTMFGEHGIQWLKYHDGQAN